MKKINIHEAKTHLSRYLIDVEKGEKIIICRHNIPVAELRAVDKPEITEKRPIGLAKGEFEVRDDFFAPLPEEIEDGFYGV
jgi:antitoxin (DNA-binding transcriptional repressor) of toxin-antitoxin stability system